MNESKDRIYTALCALFAVLIVMGNLIYQKFVFLPVLPFYTFELSVGAILYPLTFMLTDLIAEFYGKNRANFCVKLALALNITVALIIAFMDKLNATDWSKIDNDTFHKVFGLYGVSFLGSIIACYIAQLIDIRIYLLPIDKLWLLIFNSYLFKLFFSICSIPLFYASVSGIKVIIIKTEVANTETPTDNR